MCILYIIKPIKSNIAACCGLKLFKGLVRRLVWGLKNGTYFHSCRSRDRVSNTSENLRVACCILLRQVDIKRKIHLRNHAPCRHFSPNFKLHKGFLGVWPRIRLVPTVSIKQQSGMILSPSSSIHLLQSLQSLNLSNLYIYIYQFYPLRWGWNDSFKFQVNPRLALQHCIQIRNRWSGAAKWNKKDWPTFLYQFSLVQPAPQGHRIRRIPTGSSALSPERTPLPFVPGKAQLKRFDASGGSTSLASVWPCGLMDIAISADRGTAASFILSKNRIRICIGARL